jgi:hypothetical protein
MTPNYTINNVGANSAVIKTTGNEKMHMTNADKEGRQHRLSPCVILNRKNYTEGAVSVRLIILFLRLNELMGTGYTFPGTRDQEYH